MAYVTDKDLQNTIDYVTVLEEQESRIIAALEAGFEGDEIEGRCVDELLAEIDLERIPAFGDEPAFRLVIVLENPQAEDYSGLFDGCALLTEKITPELAQSLGFESMEEALDHARQAKHAAAWDMYFAGITEGLGEPELNWRDISLAPFLETNGEEEDW